MRVLEGVDRPVARAMMANLDLRHSLGIPGSGARGRKGKAPLLPFYEGIKHEHPTKVLLVRVGPLPRARQRRETQLGAFLEGSGA